MLLPPIPNFLRSLARSGLPLLATVFAILPAATLSADSVATELLADQPVLTGGISQVDDSASAGMGWRWRASDGRRDYGQSFRVEKAFSANTLAIEALFGDSFRIAQSAPFQITFLRSPGPDVLGDTERVASFQGTLPPSKDLPRDQPTWLLMEFPAVKFEAGFTYAFLLSFPGQGGEERLVILKVGPGASGALGGTGLLSEDGVKIDRAPYLNFVLGNSDSSTSVSDRPAQTFTVDQRAASGYRTIAAAVREARPGDTIALAPGSGPYRETLFISQSGEPGNPITFDGHGETVTGFEPLVFQQQNGLWVSDLKAFFASRPNIQGFKKKDGGWVHALSPISFPAVLTHRGKRIFQDAATGEFSGYGKFDPETTTLTLSAGIDPTGFEISARDFVVKIHDSSHHLYRNVKATGSLNDGINLHGTGSDLVFQNIESRQNLDEGFSAHDQIDCQIDGGVFQENDNGIGNVAQSTMTARNIKVSSNAGWGIWLLNCQGTFENVRAWDNGLAQIALHGSSVATMENVFYATPTWTTKPWLSYQESSNRRQSPPFEKTPNVRLAGTPTEQTSPIATIGSDH
jgi:hypothetical protein